MKKSTFENLPETLVFTIKYGVSKAAETYNYNTVTLTNNMSGKSYKTCGGGYDMLGTVIGDMIEDLFTPELLETKKQIEDTVAIKVDKKVVIQGAAGYSEMLRILEDILGYKTNWIYKFDRQGRADYKIGLTLNKKPLGNKPLYTEEKVLLKFGNRLINVRENLYGKKEISGHISLDKNNLEYYKKTYTPQGKDLIVVKGHSNKYYIVKV